MDKLLLRTLRGECLETPPFWLMRQAGRYLPEYLALRDREPNFLRFCHTPELCVEAALQPLRRFPLDAAILFSDILVIPDALGQKVDFVKGEGPKLDVLDVTQGLKGLDRSGMHQKLAPIYTAVRALKAELAAHIALVGFAGAPWTVATYMVEGGASREYHKIRSWAYERPDEFAVLIDLLVDVTAEYLLKQVENGAEVIQLFDSWAGILPPAEFRRWSIAPNREITRRLKQKYPDVLVIGFPKGAGLLYREFATETGVDAVSLDQTVPLDWAAGELQPLCAVQGNLDNLLLVSGGRAMEDAVRDILDKLGDGPLVFNLGHGILPQTPVDHVQRLGELVKG